MMIKRLLCIVGSMNAGGAETFLMKIYRELDKSKYQMDFAVAVASEGFYDKEIIAMGGKIHHITPKSKGILKNFNDIRALVKNEDYTYVLRTSQHSLSALELLAAKLGGAKVRVFRSSNSNTTTGSKKQMLLHKLCMFMPRFFANVRIAPSTEAAEFMFGKNCVKKGKAILVHNGIDTKTYCFSEGNRKRIRKEFNIDDNQLVLGHVGRFNQQKNHDFLIKVFSEVVKANANVVMVLVGGGELQEYIRTKVKDLGLEKKVIFTGVRNDIPALLSAFDIFVFPSLYEGMPNTVIEAQATGLPCVISDTITREAKITDLVRYISLNNSVEAWVSELIQQVFSSRNREKYYLSVKKQGYDINQCVGQFVEVIFSTI